ncbi:MAG TPA: hypothetical protein VIL55_08990 [Naasia sp.]|jgi:23S rRNA (guanine745-N1)-methyltransferase
MSSWFACPVCGRDLEVSGDGFACSSGHRFEGARRGYLALVDGRSPLIRSTPAATLDAADAAFGGGALEEVAADVRAMLPARPGIRLLDAGDDLGRLLRAVFDARPDADALTVSSSPTAIARTVARSGSLGLLADPSKPVPVREGSADVLLCAFGSPRPAEFHRLLAPGGVLLTVASEADAGPFADDAYPWFEHDQTRTASTGAGAAVVTRHRRRRRVLTWG